MPNQKCNKLVENPQLILLRIKCSEARSLIRLNLKCSYRDVVLRGDIYVFFLNTNKQQQQQEPTIKNGSNFDPQYFSKKCDNRLKKNDKLYFPSQSYGIAYLKYAT